MKPDTVTEKVKQFENLRQENSETENKDKKKVQVELNSKVKKIDKRKVSSSKTSMKSKLSSPVPRKKMLPSLLPKKGRGASPLKSLLAKKNQTKETIPIVG